jgi:uncharacterized pyridoxamine 5'-phosphate oxidase family protein
MASILAEYQTPHGLSSDVRQLVLEKSSVTLGTINPDGSPRMTLLLFSLDDHDRLYLPTHRTTRKVRNIRDRSTVTALVTIDGGWVSCTGQARIVEGAAAAALNLGVRERLLTETGLATMGRFLESHADATIEITPSKWLSWTMDPIFPWFDENGVDLDDFEGGWMKDLASAEEWHMGPIRLIHPARHAPAPRIVWATAPMRRSIRSGPMPPMQKSQR